MKIILYLSVLLLVLVNKIVTANIKIPQQYCGSRLADTMKLVCKGKYNEHGKRSQMDLEAWDYKDLEDYYSIDYPYRTKRGTMSFIPSRFVRSRPRIIDECCHKPCHISELQSYCGS